jgi:hypothetical protein
MIFLRQCDPVNGCSTNYPADLSHCPRCGAHSQFSQTALVNPRDYTYDIETYPNIFTCAFIHIATGTTWRFEISDRMNQSWELIDHIKGLAACRSRNVGYNNEFFDYPVIHHIVLTGWITVEEIYAYAMRVIKTRDPFEFFVWDRDRYIEQIDLFKIHHFDNINKATSLKTLEIAMRMPNVADLPFALGSMLNDDEKEILHNYNLHDCIATAFFYVRSISMIVLREQLSKTFDKNFLNKNDVKMGEMILVGEMEKRGISTTERIGNRNVKKSSPRASIDLGSVIFDYVKFERPEFNMVKNWIARQVITETKEVFTDIEVTFDMLQYMDPERIKVFNYRGDVYRKRKGERVVGQHKNNNPVKLSNIPKYAAINLCTFESKNLHCVINGFRYDFGVGGLHASVSTQIFKSDNQSQIVDVDVASFYPQLGIKNNLYPEHLSIEFCPAYQGVYITRKSYDKKTAENGAFKLALNGAYGGSNNEHSPFYDPRYAMTTTVNGQLLLCMLVEQVLKIPNVKMIQCNTDGITYMVDKIYVDHQRSIQRWWESVTGLELEEALYSRMFIDHVNSYIAEYDDGGLKRIGAYAHVTPDIEPGTRERVWSKDHSSLVIAKVAQRVLVEGLDARTLIEAHDDPFDFLIRGKVPRADRLFMRWPEYEYELQLQNTTRYFVSTNGGELVKVSPPSGVSGSWKKGVGVKDALYNQVIAENATQSHALNDLFDSLGVKWDSRIHTKSQTKHETREGSMCAGWRVTDCANIENFDRAAVNVDYYVAEVDKITKPLLGFK